MREKNRKSRIAGRKCRLVSGLFLLWCLLFSFTACGDAEKTIQKTEREVFAMDTIMKLTLYGDPDGAAMEKSVKEIHRIEDLLSVTKKESDIARINAASGNAVKVQKETYDLIRQCQVYGDETEGLFDISVYPVVKLWGFTTEQYQVPSGRARKEALEKVDYKKIELLPDNRIRVAKGMAIDLGAVAKGYLSQRIMELCKEQGVDSAIVSLGGNVQTMGMKPNQEPYVVGITDPSDGISIFGTLQVQDQAVITSGIYQRYFDEGGKRYHHIMDKRTGMPAENTLASVTVITKQGDRADALATALYVMGEEKAKEYQKRHPEIQLILIRKDGSFWQSEEAGMQREYSD